MPSIIPVFHAQYDFVSKSERGVTEHRYDQSRSDAIRSIISELVKAQEVTKKIGNWSQTRLTDPFNFQSNRQHLYLGTRFYGDYTLYVEVSDETFETKTVSEEPDVGFTLLIQAETDKGVPLKITLTGNKVEPFITPQYPQEFQIQKIDGDLNISNVQDLAFDSHLRDLISSLLHKPEVKDHLTQSMQKGQIDPFTLLSKDEFCYPNSSSMGAFTLTIEVAYLDCGFNTVTINYDGSFQVSIAAETDRGIPLSLVLKGSESDTHILHSRHVLYLEEEG